VRQLNGRVPLIWLFDPVGECQCYRARRDPRRWFVDPDEEGNQSDQRDVLAALKSGDLKIAAIKLSDMHGQAYDNWAIVTGAAEQTRAFGGQSLALGIVFTDSFVLRTGTWRSVASHDRLCTVNEMCSAFGLAIAPEEFFANIGRERSQRAVGDVVDHGPGGKNSALELALMGAFGASSGRLGRLSSSAGSTSHPATFAAELRTPTGPGEFLRLALLRRTR
jgi:hypothetical protein